MQKSMPSEGPSKPSQIHSTLLVILMRSTSIWTQHMNYTTYWIHLSTLHSYTCWNHLAYSSLGWKRMPTTESSYTMFQTEEYVFKPHHIVHCVATSTKIEAGRAPAQTITFSTKQIIDNLMSNWANQYWLSQYIGQHFMYPRWSVRRQDHAGAKCKLPSHLNSGTWLKDVDHFMSLTAQMVHGLTSHTPIGHYRK